MRSKTIVVIALAAAALFLEPVSTWAQASLFAPPQALTFASVRTMGMGNIGSVVIDPYSRNPAHAAWLEKPEGNALYARFSFDGGLDADYQMYRYEFPLKWTRRKDGLQLVYYRLTSDQGRITPPPPLSLIPVPLNAEMEDEGVYLGYGSFVGKRTAVGVSTAFRNSQVRVFAPTLGGLQLAEGDSDSLITPKVRVAVQHQLTDRWGVAGILTASDQRGTTASSVVPLINSTEDFTQLDYDLGVAYHASEKVLLAGEWRKQKLTSTSFAYRDYGLNFGAEVKVSDKCDLRAGSNEGNMTLGASYHAKDWRVEYAYVNDFESDDLAPLFGKATLHTINVTKQF
ncbi:MAG: hypothetical protein HY318_19745 [Armatimonadetes bacterium]|nr:hypothetical protein [Armatimonadota bacterium]